MKKVNSKKTKIKPDYSPPKSLTYKGTVFKIRENYLGVGKQLDELMQAYGDDELLSSIWVYRLPEFRKLEEIKSDVYGCLQDLNNQKEQLKSCKDMKERDRLEGIINKLTIAINEQKKNLYEPSLYAVSTRLKEIQKGLDFQFVNDLGNIKKAATALLEGDISIINFENPEPELVELAEILFKVFFYTRNKILNG